MKIPEQMLLMFCLVWQTTSIPALSQSLLATDLSRSSLLADSSANTYTPGQPIKLHDYGTSKYGKSSSGAGASYTPTTTPATLPNASTTPSAPYQSPAPTTPASLTAATAAPATAAAETPATAVPPTDTTSASTPAKKGRLGQLFNALLGPLPTAGTSAATPGFSGGSTTGLPAPGTMPSVNKLFNQLDPMGRWRAAASQITPPAHDTVPDMGTRPAGTDISTWNQMIKMQQITTGFLPPPAPTGNYLQDRQATEAGQVRGLHISNPETYDPTSVSWEHYLKYNFVIAELANHGFMPADQGRAEIRENEARSQFLFNQTVTGIDPAIVAKWQIEYSWSKGGSRFNPEKNCWAKLKWGVPGSNPDTVTWNLNN